MRINRQRDYYNVPKRIFKKVLITLLIFGIPSMLFLSMFSIKEVEVVGSKRYTDKQIKQMVLKTRLDYNSVYLYLKYHYQETPEIPFVEKLNVEIAGNHKVKIDVYEKMVIGCIEFMGEYLYFDKDGIVVESSAKKIEDVPIINGLQFNEIVLNKKLDVLNYEDVPNEDNLQRTNSKQKEGNEPNKEDDQKKTEEQSKRLYNIILNITKLVNKYKLDVDSINFNDKNEIVLRCGEIKVLLGEKSNYDEALSDLKTILAKAKGTDIYQLDMTNYSSDSNYVIGKSKKTAE